MEPIRILFAGLPRLLTGILGELLKHQPELTIVASVPASTPAAMAAMAHEADVVLLMSDDLAPALTLLEAQRVRAVLAFDTAVRRCDVYTRGARRTLDDVSCQDLIAAMRRAPD